MAAPTDLNSRLFADDYFDLSLQPKTVTVTATLNQNLVHVGDGPTIFASPISATTDAAGHLEIRLPCTDDPEYVGDGTDPVAYHVQVTGLTSFDLTVESALPDVKLRLHTKAPYGVQFSVTDLGDGTERLTGVTDLGDGTYTITAPSVIDNNNGTYTYVAG